MSPTSRLQAIDATMPHLAQGIPDLPTQQTLLIRLIRMLDQSLSTLLANAIVPHGFTEATLHTLMLVSSLEEHDISPSLLCQMVAQPPQNMTRILRTLSEQGYLQRQVDAKDGRRSRIAITAQGQQRLAEVLPATIPAVSAGFSGLSQREQQTLEQLLRKAIVSLDQAAVQQSLPPPPRRPSRRQTALGGAAEKR